MTVDRLLAAAARGERRSAVARRYRVGARVLAARQPKLLRASTRLAVARRRVPLGEVPPAAVLAAPPPVVFEAPPAAVFDAPPAAVFEAPPAAVSAAPPSATTARPPVLARAARPAPAPARPAPAPAPAPAPVQISRSPEPAVAPPVEVARSPEPAAAPALTPESLGIGPASFEWLFGDPEKALAHPDVTRGPIASLPQLSPAERTERRVARLTARGGSAYGRGSQISEGPAPAPAPMTASERLPADPPPRPVDPPAIPSDPPAAEQQSVIEAPAPVLQRAPSAPPPASSEPPPAPSAPAAAPSEPAPRPTRQRLVPGRRPESAPARPLARAIDDSTPVASPPAPATPPVAAPTPMPMPAPSPSPAVAMRRAAAVPSPKPPPPPSPGPPPVRLLARPPAARPELVQRRPVAPARPARPAVQRAARPAPPAAPEPAAPRPSLFRRALAALKPAPTQNFGDPVEVSATSAPKFAPKVARVTLDARAEGLAPDLHLPGATHPETSPQPGLWASAERSSQPLTRASAGPPSQPATPAAPKSTGDPDAAYRDLLSRVREEREQLGQLISHPF